MTHFTLPAIRYASDMPFAVGMVLADEFGNTTEIRALGTTGAVLASLRGAVSLGTIRRVYPYLVFVTELVAAAEAIEAEYAENDLPDDFGLMDYDGQDEFWAKLAEGERVEALAEAAQHEDDLKAEILDRAAAEWKRKNSWVSDCGDADREDGLHWRAAIGCLGADDYVEAHFATKAEARAWAEVEGGEVLDRTAAAEAREWADMCAERDLSAKALSDRELYIELHDRMEYEG